MLVWNSVAQIAPTENVRPEFSGLFLFHSISYLIDHMDRATAFGRFCTQRSHARFRGIGWHFTFEQWLEWWGDDLDRRGPRQCQLSMQRIGDKGPYAPSNVVKGYPADNVRTAASLKLVRNSDARHRHWQQALDAAPVTGHYDRSEECTEDEWELRQMFEPRRSLRIHSSPTRSWKEGGTFRGR